MSEKVAVRLLGPPEVLVGGRWVAMPSRRRAALLGYLALEGATERAELAALLWESPTAAGNLRAELFRIERRYPGLLRREGTRVALAAGSDVQRFLQMVLDDDPEEAVRLYRGPFLEGVQPPAAAEFEDWLLLSRNRLEERYLDALVRLADRKAEDDPAAALELHRQVLARDPVRESSCRAVMRLYARQGEVQRALAYYAEYAAFLERELGVAPVQATRALADELRSGRARTQRWKRAELAGRDAEVRQALEALEAGRHVILTGEPGIGKTRLIHELAAVQGRRPLLMRGRPEDRRVPLATAVRALRAALAEAEAQEGWVLRELARLLPELGDPPAEEAPHRFLAAIGEVLRALDSEKWLWGVDDLQFFDDASLDLLGQLASQRIRRPLVLAYRTGTLERRAEVWVQSLIERDGAEPIELGPLEEADVGALVPDGVELTGEWRTALHRYTGGNPFFVLQAVEAWREEGRFGRAEPCPELSERLFTLLRQRIAVLPVFERSLLRLAAVAGEAYCPLLAARVLEATPLAVAEAADELEYQGLFRRGRLAHDLVREAVLRTLDEATVRALHEQVAERIVGELPPGLVAAHFEAAGRLGRAAAFRLRAAEDAVQGFAYREALEQYHQAFALAPEPERSRLLGRTLITRYRIAVALADRERLRFELDATEKAAAELGDAYLQRNVAVGRLDALFRANAFDRALAEGRRLLEDEGLAPDQRAMATYVVAQSLLYKEPRRSGEAARLCEEALGYVDEGWYMWGWAHNTLALCRLHRGDLDAAEAVNGRAFEHFRARRDLPGQANSHRIQALIHWRRGELDAARTRFGEALALARKAGFRTILTLVHDWATAFYEAEGPAAALRELRATEEDYGLAGRRRLLDLPLEAFT